MSHRQHAVLVGAVAIASFVAAARARAAVTLTARYSEATAFAQAYGATNFGDGDGRPSNPRDSTTGTGGFNSSRNASSSSSSGLNEAAGYAFQTSGFTMNGSALAGANATGEMSADGTANLGGAALGSGYSEFDFAFSVTGAAAPYTLTGTLASNQGSGATFVLKTSSGTVIKSFANNATMNESGTLAVGNYVVEMSGFVSVSPSGSGTQHGTGNFSMAMDFPSAPVPEPATGLLVVAPAIGLLTRRRQRHA